MIKEVIQNYLESLVSGEMDRVISLFETDGVVKSPLYGILPAVEFYSQLETDTVYSKIDLQAVFEDKYSNKGVAHFVYHWSLASGKEVEFECADIFEFSESGKITFLTILYDTKSIDL